MVKKEDLKEISRLLIIPFVLLGVSLIFILLWKVFGLPPPDEMVEIIENFFEEYGLIIIFISALIEGVLLVGQYFPGGAVIFLGVITAGRNVPRVIEVVLIVSLAFFISYNLNYILGKYGWYNLFAKLGLRRPIDNSKKRLQKHLVNGIFLSYWQPNLAAITATAAGVLKINFRKFAVLSLLGILVWNTFWGTLVFFLGQAALNLVVGLKYVLIIFVIWISIIITKYFLFDKKNDD